MISIAIIVCIAVALACGGGKQPCPQKPRAVDTGKSDGDRGCDATKR